MITSIIVLGDDRCPALLASNHPELWGLPSVLFFLLPKSGQGSFKITSQACSKDQIQSKKSIFFTCSLCRMTREGSPNHLWGLSRTHCNTHII